MLCAIESSTLHHQTTSSSGLTFNGSTLSVTAINCSSITGNISGSAGSAIKVAVTGPSPSGSKNVALVNGTGSSEQVQADGGFTFNTNNNNLSVGGDITAFASDMRLKQNLEQIEGAVAKVCKLSGFTYEFNAVGRELKLPKR